MNIYTFTLKPASQNLIMEAFGNNNRRAGCHKCKTLALKDLVLRATKLKSAQLPVLYIKVPVFKE